MDDLFKITRPVKRRRKKLPATALRICLADEKPAWGCGWRVVEVRSIGAKWVSVRNVTTGQGTRFAAKVWAVIAKKARPVLCL